MNDRKREIFDAVRELCSPALWSRGVELSRADAVASERSDPDEAVFRISLRGGMLSRVVTLFLDDGEWECECGEEACEHAAAAVIAWRRADEEGRSLAAARPGLGRVGYRFERAEGGLALSRVIAQGQESWPLEATLAAVTSGRVDGPRVVAAQHDLAVELALGTHRRGLLPRPLVEKSLRLLARCPDVTLDGRPVETSGEPVLPRVRVEDQGDGFRVSLAPEEGIEETFANGIVLLAGVLRPTAEAPLTGRELHELPGGRYYGPDTVPELVSDVLPDLRRRMPLDVRTSRLPRGSRETPRIRVETSREDETLSVLATLVYGDPPRARIDGGRLVHLEGAIPLRDGAAERRELRRLQQDLGLAAGVREEFHGAEAVGFKSRLDAWRGRVEGSAQEWFRLAPPLEPRLELDSGFELSFESAGPGRRRGASADEVLRRWSAGEHLVPLTGGGWAPLPEDWLRRFGHRIVDLLAARDVAGELPTCALPDLARLCEDLDRPPPPALDGLRGLIDGFVSIPQVEPPGDLTVELRDYQRRGVDWLTFLRDARLGAMLADDMGLGKTLQALCALRGCSLVVAPTSVVHNWASEIERHRPGLRCSVYHGTRRSLDPAADVTLTTYALLRLDVEILSAESWDAVVLDEAQAIKNPDSQVAAAAYRLRADFRLTLTGTPVENRLDELWSQFHFTNPGLLGGRRDFDRRYGQPIAAGDDEAARRLRERIRPFLLRRLKREVAPELPPRTEVVLRCQLEPSEREVYDAVRVTALSEVMRKLDAGGNVLAALEALLRLRQAACHPSLVPGQQAEGSAKLALLLETLDSIVAEGHKALVFSQWTSLLDLTEPHLRRAGIDFLRLDGSTVDRGGVVAAFQDSAGPPVLLISLKAGGTGLNLTAADHIFLLDPWWNPAVEDQAADRAHRIGQERPVMVYRLVAEETVEERILLLQQGKREIARAALEGSARAATLTREDLLDLLRPELDREE